MYFVYILYSPDFGKSYTGQTNNLLQRLERHNHSPENTFTSKYRPWVIVHSESFPSRGEAMKREKWLKTGIGREFIQDMIRAFLYPT